VNELAGIGLSRRSAENSEYFAEILRGDLRRLAADFGRIFARSRRQKSSGAGREGPSAGRRESVRMVRIEGRLAQRLEHPAYTGKVRGSNP
jgi:hypothetical protein